jgi:uncharacterized membrane protein YeaQ/YmgE (transglycosylase-associated protein family)
MEMGFWQTIIVGLVTGTIAKMILPGRNGPGGFAITALVGVIGAFIASYFLQMTGSLGEGQGAGWIASIVGAIVALIVFGAVTKKSTPT